MTKALFVLYEELLLKDYCFCNVRLLFLTVMARAYRLKTREMVVRSSTEKDVFPYWVIFKFLDAEG